MRRTGSLTIARRRSRPNTGVILCYGGPHSELPSPRIPNELIERIVEFVLSLPRSYNLSKMSVIASITLASGSFRQIALRCFLRDVSPSDKTHWLSLLALLAHQRPPASFSCVKNVSISSTDLLVRPGGLALMGCLNTVQIDMFREGLSTQHPAARLIFPALKSSGPSLRSLVIFNMACIDTRLLSLIAESLPCLRNLYLSCTERLRLDCCWSCFEDSMSCIIHSPVGNDYVDWLGLTTAFGNALKPLKRLQNLHLGIFLSEERLLQAYIDHCMEHWSSLNTSLLQLPEEHHICYERAVEVVHAVELAASLYMARIFGQLRTIGWSSLFLVEGLQVKEGEKSKLEEVLSEDDDADGGTPDTPEPMGEKPGDEMQTTIYVQRKDGRVSGKKTPWV